MRKIESTGRPSALLSSLRLSRATTPPVLPAPSVPSPACAVVVASSVWIASIVSTTPTRLPPIRTSLLFVRRAASGISTETR